ncbi:MAG TPA: galactose oxidase-like domain-containing protein [Actinomycetota bacterium]|nr:galactose oxidase-like domain-containing protein [Actinomycetota bacterium]
MRTVAVKLAVAALSIMVLLAWQMPVSKAQSPAAAGQWLSPFSEDFDGDGIGDFDARPPLNRSESASLPPAVNAVVLADGTVLYWSQLEGSESVEHSIAFQQPAGPRSRSRVLDLSSYFASGALPSPAAFATPAPEDGAGGDMVGTDQRHLADGRVLVIGGTRWSNEDPGAPGGFGRTELYGLPDARVFDPLNGTWSRAADMNRPRYYPSMVTLADGRMLVASGADRLVYDSAIFPGPHPSGDVRPANVHEVEVFDPTTGTWTLPSNPESKTALPPFAHLHLMPDGRVLYPGAGMFYPPGGADAEADRWHEDRIYDPASRSWTAAGRPLLGARSNAFTSMMRLTPPYDSAQILVGGGTLGPWPGSHVATTLTEILTWRGGSVERAAARPMTAARWHASAVTLPTGEVVALGGADKDEVVDPGSGLPVRHAELFDPATRTWRKLARAARDRTLHHTAVLLRDGSILTGGHSPVPAHYGAHTTNVPGLSNNFKDPSFEIFRPPYLFRGERPRITGLSPAAAANGATLRIDTPDAHNATLQVVLSRLPATTHVIDNDQRTVLLGHVIEGDGSVRVTVPDAAVVPPGHYYVFVLKDNGSGPTPSVAEIVRVGS